MNGFSLEMRFNCKNTTAEYIMLKAKAPPVKKNRDSSSLLEGLKE